MIPPNVAQSYRPDYQRASQAPLDNRLRASPSTLIRLEQASSGPHFSGAYEELLLRAMKKVSGPVVSPNQLILTYQTITQSMSPEERQKYNAYLRYQLHQMQPHLYRPVVQMEHYRIQPSLNPYRTLQSVLHPPVHTHYSLKTNTDGPPRVVAREDRPGLMARITPIALTSTLVLGVTALLFAVFRKKRF